MEKIEGLSIGLDLNTLKIDSGLKDLKSKLSLVNSEMKANLSVFDRADKSINKYESRISGLNKKIEVQKAIVDKAQKSYEKMVKEHGEGSTEAEKAARAYNNEAAKLNSLERYIKNVTEEMKEFQRQQKIQNSTLFKAGDSLIKFGSGLKSISDKTKELGQNLTNKITKPAVGAASALAGIALVKGFGRLVGIDTAKAKLKGLGHDAKSVELIMESAMASVRGTSYGMDEAATTAASAVAAGIKPGKELTRYLSLTGDAAAIAGASMSEMGSIINQVQTSQVAYTDNLNQLADRGIPIYQWLGKEAGVAAADVKKMASDGKISSQMFLKAIEKNIGGAAKKMGKESFTASISNMWAAVGRLGASFLDAGGKGGGFFSQLKPMINDFTGRLDDMGDIAQEAGVKFGKMFVGFVEKIKSIKASYDNLSPTMKDFIKNSAIAGTALAVGIGPSLKVLGTFGGFIGKISVNVGKFSKTIAEAGGFLKWLRLGLTALTGPVGLTTLGIAGLAAGFVVLDKKMDKPIIKSDIFKGKISDATKAAVGSYMKLDEDATAELNSLAYSSQTITDGMAKHMVSKYQEMGDKILQAMKENHAKQLQEQQSLFDQSSVLTEQEEAKRLAKLKADQLKEEEAHTKSQARIKEIWTTAANQKRGISDAEAKEIARLQEQMRTKAVQEMSASQKEQETILKNLKNNKSIIEAETAANTVKKSLETKNKVVKEANKQYSDTVAYAKTARDELHIISAEEAKKIIQEAKNKRNKVVSKAEDMHIKVIKSAKSQAGEHVDQVNWETGEVLSKWDNLYNGVLSAANWIRGLFGKEPIAKKGSIKENGRQKIKRQNAVLKPATKSYDEYAKGTPSTGHPGGPAIVGEEGRELAHIPGQGLTLLGASGPELFSNLPRGTSVLPNKQTEKLLKSYGFPGYADGIGDFFDLFLKGADSVWNFATDKFGLNKIALPSMMNNLIGNPLKSIGEMATSWIKDLWGNWFGDIGGSTGAGVQKWAGIAAKALSMTGQFTKANLDRLLYQMQTESGGNPRAINLWDINALRGTPSKGLMQVIDPTFKAYAMPGYNKNIWDPLSNILASIRYALSRYGSLARAYRGVGYETGGLINNEGLYRLAEGGYPEWVIPSDPSRRTDAMKLLALAGRQIQGNKRPNQLPNVSNNNSEINELVSRQDQQISLMQKQIELLTQLVLKDSNVYIGSKEIYDANKKEKDRQDRTRNVFKGVATI
ncbi:tape measure protein [Heyndrickxia sporothermodurans]|uniref:tape measure protein n=1 Tax=Heyndrickxia sporothermodurans TaxID=46224 RepID=UPI002E1FECD2|nr:tape measure protein [Heyndrickxia sporothermodurans]MED3697369.1 tape measure protein [Heyndrickxia sporothermodurans]